MKEFAEQSFIEQPFIEQPQVSLAAKLMATFKAWRNRSIQRKALANLSDHMLKDIGISRFDANAENEKPFWRE